MRRVLSVLLALCLLIGIVPLSASATENNGSLGGSVTYSFDPDTGVLTVSGSGPIRDYVHSPSHDPSPIVELAGIKSIVIEEGITYIGNNAFENWDNYSNTEGISSISLPSTLEGIGSTAFTAGALTSLRIPAGVTSIHSRAFEECPLLDTIEPDDSSSFRFDSAAKALYGGNGTTLVTLLRTAAATSYSVPEGVTRIEKNAFTTCESITQITLPSTLKELYSLPTGITEVELPEGLTTFGDAEDVDSTFYNLQIKKLVFPNTVTSLCRLMNLFYLESVTLPNTLTEIPENMFFFCSSLTSIVIPEGVTTIGHNAFGRCESLKEVTIPVSVTSIAKGAFSYYDPYFGHHDPLPQSWSSSLDNGAEVKSSITDVYYGGTKAQWAEIKETDEAQDNRVSSWREAWPLATIHCTDGDIEPTGDTDPTPTPTPAPPTDEPTPTPVPPTDEPTPTPDPIVGGFTDVKESDYFAGAVIWAVEKGITTGTSKDKFSPNTSCTRVQIMTFLWRANGSQEPSKQAEFRDMTTNTVFNSAISWAVEKGITSGVGDNRFGTNSACTRAQAVTFLWIAAGRPAPAKTADFSDMPSNPVFRDAISWAVEKGITGGTGDNRFSPNKTCTRAQIVTLLKAAEGK